MKQNWKYQKMGDTFVLQMGKTPPRKNEKYWGGNNTWISIGDMGNSKFISSSKEKISDLAIKDTGIKIVPKGTVIMSFKLSVGKVGIANSDLYSNEAIMAFIPKCETTIISDYLFYYLKGYKWENSNRAVKGITLNKELISKGIIAIPGIEAQRLIVEELDLIQSIIDKQKRQLLELDNLQQSIFHNMFGDPITNEKDFSYSPLKESVIEMFLGPFGSALKTSFYVGQDKSFCMVYEQKHAIKGTFNLENHFIDQERFHALKRFEVIPGDFIMSCRGTIGKVFLLPDNAPKGIIHPSLMKIRIKKEIYTNLFFEYLLKKIIEREHTKGNCVQMAITAKELGAKKVICPPLALQEEFAEKIEAIERQKELIKKSIADSEQLLNYTMDKYFG